MLNKQKHKEVTQIENESKLLFSKGEINWEKSKEAVWDEVFAKKQNNPAIKMHIWTRKMVAIAASIALLVGIASTLMFYSKTIVCPAGEHLAVQLPDGSEVNLNASSNLTYKPLVYYLHRKLKFEGEGFFSVKKGKQFIVESEKAITRVLGTSFNIFTRDGEYKLTCLTGKVKISSSVNNSAILNPNDYAEVNNNGLIKIINNYNAKIATSWQENRFFYTGEPLSKVIKEIERQYNVKINLSQDLDYNVSINFSTIPTIEEVLDYVCKPRLFTFVKDSEGVYTIIQNN